MMLRIEYRKKNCSCYAIIKVCGLGLTATLNKITFDLDRIEFVGVMNLLVKINFAVTVYAVPSLGHPLRRRYYIHSPKCLALHTVQ